MHRVLRISDENCFCLHSKERVPYHIIIEVAYDPEEIGDSEVNLSDSRMEKLDQSCYDEVQQQKAKEVIQQFLDAIIQELAAGNRLEFRDFGVFEPKSKAARMARNPRTGDRIAVPQKVTVKFKSGRMMKEKLQPEAAEDSPESPESPSALS